MLRISLERTAGGTAITPRPAPGTLNGAAPAAACSAGSPPAPGVAGSKVDIGLLIVISFLVPEVNN